MCFSSWTLTSNLLSELSYFFVTDPDYPEEGYFYWKKWVAGLYYWSCLEI